ncbi:MAG TPA: DUF305 domain-containing protein [Mycobacterium sp.]
MMMKKKLRTAALVAVPLATALFLAGCAGSGDSMPGMDHGGGSSSAPSESAEADFNMADSMFAMMMIPHHQRAVEMSDMILAKSDVDQQVLDLAQQIKDAQQPEIDTMQGWLDDWGMSADDMDMGDMDHGGGMMSEEDMAQLEAATGADAARMFLEQMIEHHKGAIEMAETELADGKNPDAKELAQAVVDTQSAEITTMEDLLAQL